MVDYMDSENMVSEVMQHIQTTEKLDYSHAANELGQVMSDLSNIRRFNIQFGKGISEKLLDEDQCATVWRELTQTSDSNSKAIQNETAKKIVQKLMQKASTQDVGTNTQSNELDAYKTEIQLQTVKIKDLTL